jgi:aerobic carbon-monoxide dehydrogenase medium subunit
VLASPTGERRVAADRFFLGLYETDMQDDEIIVAVEVPAQRAGQNVAILEIARRSGDYAMAGVACSVTIGAGTVTAARLVYFGVGGTPVLAEEASAALVGRALDAAAINAAQAALGGDLDPPDDMHGSGEMKRHLARVLTRRALNSFIETERRAA